MVRSLALVGAAVAVLLVLVPRPDRPIEQPVDVAQTAAQAGVDADFPLVVPDVPAGWRATAARAGTDGPEAIWTWHVGYVTGAGEYAGLEVAREVTPGWLREQTSAGTPDEEAPSLAAGGRTWQVLRAEDPARTSLVSATDGVTTVVTGSASLADLVRLAVTATG